MKLNRTGPRTGSSLTLFQRLVLNACAAAGTLCLVMAVLALAFGIKPLVFASGSMGPGIPTGSLGLAVPTAVEDAAIGDVVSVVISDEVRVTHRVVEKTDEGLILKGDANPVADLQPYAVDSVDKLLASVPVLGYVVSWLSQPWAYSLGGLLCAYLLYVAFIKRDGGSGRLSSGQGVNEAEMDPGPFAGREHQATEFRVSGASRESMPQRSRRRTLIQMAGMFSMLTLCLLPIQIEQTQAAFSSQAAASATATALTALPPANAKCTGNVGDQQTIRFDWSVSGPEPTSYTITGQLNGSSTVKTESLAGNTRSYTTSLSSSQGLLGALLDLLVGFDRKFTVAIRANYGSWSSAPVSFTQIHGSAGLLGINKRLTCQPH
ncbi:signal peptidase I [Glutamicibacter sp. NPDC090743]|uniref:signal peptidase I n=1 Tax=Glutamicibacter sp. NPDC090743 TaxID=3364001 RepID=UPI00380E3098